MQKDIIISLGTNLGNREENLYRAISLLENKTITIIEISSAYETPSWGFKGNSFYNACARINTFLSPYELLKELLKVEEILGRKRNKKNGYQDRVIDLDILFYGDEIIFSNELKVPHSKLHLRNFILLPLIELTPKLIHPILKITIKELYHICPDDSFASKVNIDLNFPPIFDSFSYISIEGNIGVGKTTLAKMISKNYKINLQLENFSTNPYLELFYENPKKYAFRLENHFLVDRFTNHTKFWQKKPQAVVSDFCLYKCLVFAKTNLSKNKFSLFNQKFNIDMKNKKNPNLIFFLKSSTSQLLKQIKMRERNYEQEIKQEYLDNLDKNYSNILNKIFIPYVEYSVEGIDFENDEIEFKKILRVIFKKSFYSKNPK